MNTDQLQKNIHDLLFKNIKLTKTQKVLVLYDTDCVLTTTLKDAYEYALQGYNASLLLYSPTVEEEWKEKLFALSPHDLVVLIQSTSFRISSYRIRLDLTNRDIYCIEHVRLAFMKEEEYGTYTASLTYDQDYYEQTSLFLIDQLKKCTTVTIVSTDGSRLLYDTHVDAPKRNIGDFTETKGTLFPIGEVFTEPMHLDKVNGSLLVHGFPSLDHRTLIVRPFKVIIEKGCIVSHQGPEAFEQLLALLRTENEDQRVPLREMGFGMNRFISKDKPLNDISSHERQKGYHMSLGLKHNVYRKKISKEKNQRFHVDLFADVKQVYIDDVLVFDEEYLVSSHKSSNS